MPNQAKENLDAETYRRPSLSVTRRPVTHRSSDSPFGSSLNTLQTDYHLESMLISNHVKGYGRCVILTGAGVPGSCFDEGSLREDMLPLDGKYDYDRYLFR